MPSLLTPKLDHNVMVRFISVPVINGGVIALVASDADDDEPSTYCDRKITRVTRFIVVVVVAITFTDATHGIDEAVDCCCTRSSKFHNRIYPSSCPVSTYLASVLDHV